MTSSAPSWQNWGRTESATPARVVAPGSVDELAGLIAGTRGRPASVRAIGSGHSFSGIGTPVGVQVELSGMRGLVKVDGDRATFRAGTYLWEIPDLLKPHGLAMANLGDIDRQTLAGAISTGTHGTGLRFGGISTQVTEVTLVTGTGEVRTLSRPAELAAAALGLGALGIMVEITVACVPAFSIEAVEQSERIDDVLASLPASIAGNDHFEFYWFPHTEAALTKRNRRLPGLAPASGPSRARRYIDDELLSNKVFGAICRLGARAPGIVPAVNRVSGNVLSGRTVVDASAAIFTSSRAVRFREMEYAVPLAKLPQAFDRVRKVIADNDYRVSFPVEVRVAAADDLLLSTASGQAAGYIAVHRYYRDAPDGYFRDVEAELVRLGGRPHWGKMHTRDAEYLRSVYPGFGEFTALRDELDAERVFTNPYLQRVLGA